MTTIPKFATYVAILSLLPSCLQRGQNAQRQQMASELSMIKVVFKPQDEQQEKWKKVIKEKKVSLGVTDECGKKYHSVADDQILATDEHIFNKDESAFDFQTLEFAWDVFKGCTYILRFEFGEKVNGAFVAYYASNPDGDIVVTKNAVEKPKILLKLTDAGKAKEKSLLGVVESADLSAIEVEIDFSKESHPLAGVYEMKCVPEPSRKLEVPDAAAPGSMRETITITQDVIRVVQEHFDSGGCNDENLLLTEVGFGKVTYAATSVAAGTGGVFDHVIFSQLKERYLIAETDEVSETYKDAEKNCGVSLPTPGMQVFIDLVKYAPDPACSFQYTPGSMNLLETVRLKGAELFLSKKTYISPGKLGTKTRSSVIDETKKYIKKP